MTGRRDWIPGRLSMAAARRALAFSFCWALLVEGDPKAWGLAVPIIGAAVLVSLLLVPAATTRWRLGGLIRFVPFFLWKSLSGGTDVARRALCPRMRLRPRFYHHALRLEEPAARIFLASAVSLLPGTLSVDLDLERGCLELHVLSRGSHVAEDLDACETRVGELFASSR